MTSFTPLLLDDMWPFPSSNIYRSNAESSSHTTLATVTAGTAIVAVGAFFLRNSIKENGWEGTLRYIWEGDVYSGDMRVHVDSLEKAEVARAIQESRLSSMEEALERARLESVDETNVEDEGKRSNVQSRKDIAQKWVSSFDGDLSRTLADVSDKLDKVASQVDEVIFSLSELNADNLLMRQLRQRKKLLSKTIILDMERCDALIASYQVLQEHQQSER